MKLSARERRLVRWLAAAAGLWALWLVWQLARPDALPDGGGGPRPGRAQARAALPLEVVAVRTDRLDPQPRDLAAGRDPFRFQAPPPPAPVPPTAEELERRRQAAEARRLEEERRRQEALIPRPPAVDLRLLGTFGTRQRPIAVFVDASGTNVLNAREGDTLEDKFIVERIGFESVDLGFVGFPDAPAQRLGISP